MFVCLLAVQEFGLTESEAVDRNIVEVVNTFQPSLQRIRYWLRTLQVRNYSHCIPIEFVNFRNLKSEISVLKLRFYL